MRPNKMLKVCCFLFFGVFAVASAGWSQRPTPIRLAYSSPTITNAPIWIGADLGIFKKHGVDTELTFIASSTTLTQAMVAGEIQFAQMGIGPAIPASLSSGKQFVALFATVDRIAYQFVSLKKAKDVKSLKRWGISRFGSSSDLILRLGLEQLGVDPEKDVVILQVGGNPDRVAALNAGLIDGTLLEAPSSLLAPDLNVVKDLSEINYPFFFSGLITIKEIVDSKRSVVDRVARAYAEAVHVFRSDPARSVPVIEKFMRMKGPSIMEAYRFSVKNLLEPVPRPTEEGILNAMKLLAKRDPRLMKVPPSSYIDASYVEKFQKEKVPF
ncbi:MAG: ABC transporter substrate-binding protein [Candidatus Binatia bacterium]